MIIKMNETKLATPEQIREFLAGTTELVFAVLAEEPDCELSSPPRCDASLCPAIQDRARRAVCLLQSLSSYSRQHLSRLIAEYRDTLSLDLANRARRICTELILPSAAD